MAAAAAPRVKKWHTAIGIVVVLVALLLVVGAVAWLVHVVAGLQKEVAAALVTGSATVFVAVTSVLLTRHYERQRDLRLALRDKKVPVYEAFTENMMKLLFKTKDGGLKPEEAAEFLRKWTPQLMAWGSDEVVAAWSMYQRKHSKPSPPGDLTPILEFEDFVLLLRRDLGHRNRGVGRGAILGMFVTDLDEHLATSPSTAWKQT